MGGDLNSQSLTIVYGILYGIADDIRYLPRRLIRSLYTIHSFCARLQNALLRPSAPFSLPRSCCWFFFGWVWKARRGGGSPEPPLGRVFFFFFFFSFGWGLEFSVLTFELQVLFVFLGVGVLEERKTRERFCDK
jgi:hypothetical protein